MLLKRAAHEHKWLLILLMTLASLLLLYSLLGFLFAPWYAARQLVNTLQERLQISAVIADSEFNPFTFEASLGSVQLTTDAGNSLLVMDRLYVNFQPWQLLSRKVRFEELEIAKPQVYFNRFSESDNTFSRLAERWQQSALPPASGRGRTNRG